jgi:hypothetical protein
MHLPAAHTHAAIVPGACNKEEQVVEWSADPGSRSQRGPRGGLRCPTQEKPQAEAESKLTAPSVLPATAGLFERARR